MINVIREEIMIKLETINNTHGFSLPAFLISAAIAASTVVGSPAHAQDQLTQSSYVVEKTKQFFSVSNTIQRLPAGYGDVNITEARNIPPDQLKALIENEEAQLLNQPYFCLINGDLAVSGVIVIDKKFSSSDSVSENTNLQPMRGYLPDLVPSNSLGTHNRFGDNIFSVTTKDIGSIIRLSVNNSTRLFGIVADNAVYDGRYTSFRAWAIINGKAVLVVIVKLPDGRIGIYEAEPLPEYKCQKAWHIHNLTSRRKVSC